MKKIINILIALGLVLALSVMTVPASAQAGCTAPVTNLKVGLNTSVECEVACYTINFTTTNGLSVGQWIRVKFPAATDLSAATATVNTTSATVHPVGPGEIDVLVPAGMALPAGTGVTVEICDVANAPVGSYTITVKTETDTCPVTASFTICKGGDIAPTSLQWGINSSANITLNITWGCSAEVCGPGTLAVYYNGTTLMTATTDYWVVGDKLIINGGYLDALNLTTCSPVKFIIDFIPGCNRTLWVDPHMIFSVPLVEGWNLISLPKIPKNTDIKVILAKIDASVESVWYWDACAATPTWKVHKNNSSFQTLNTMDYCAAYWICMSASATLTVEGYDFPCPPAVPPKCCYCKCWNMVGFKSQVSMTVEEYAGNLTLATVEGILTYDAGWQVLNAGSTMNPGQGYWMSFTAPTCIVPPPPAIP